MTDCDAPRDSFGHETDELQDQELDAVSGGTLGTPELNQGESEKERSKSNDDPLPIPNPSWDISNDRGV